MTELTDEKIGSLIDRKIADACSWFSSRLSTEREKVLEYINREHPRAPASGSTWVSPDVYQAVEYMRAQLGDTFSAGSGIVTFDALHPQDIEAARIASEYTNFCFYKMNPGERIVRDAIFDGLTARVGVAKVWWDHDFETEVLPFENVTLEELQQWQSMDEVDSMKADLQPDGTYKGKLVKKKNDISQVRVEVINPEEFSIQRDAKALSKKYFCVHRTMKTINWIVTNYPDMKGREDELRGSGETDDLSLSPEVQARFRPVNDGLYLQDTEIQDELREVAIYECYAQFMRKGDIVAQLYKVLRCGKVTIDIEPVDDLPFVVFTPIPRPGMFYGENYARTVMPTQDIMTAGTRTITNHAMITVNPRFIVTKGALVNPRELLDNRLGGIINVKSQGGVEPMQQPAMNPMLSSLMQSLAHTNEAITGISAASIGLNKDVLSSQNSAGLVEQQTGNSQIRQKEIARNFADHFLVPLFEKIYALVVAYEKRPKIVQLTGNWVTVDPRQWAEGRTATASVHLGYGEKVSRAKDIMQFMQALKAGGGDQFAGPQGEYAMLSDAMTLYGQKGDIARYLPITPDKIQPQGPSPKDQAEIMQRQADAYSKRVLADAAQQKADNHGEMAAMKQRLHELETMLNADKVSREQQRKDMETLNRIDLGQREMEMLENPPAGTEERGIISPKI